MNDDLVIYYEDRVTEEQVDNHFITFYENYISVYNVADNKTYILNSNPSYVKERKGNAKLAYECIAKKIFSFKNPSSVVVTGCYVDYDERKVYATIQATNGFGALTTSDYRLYEIGGYYFMDEYSHNYSTNINLDELNEKLQSYVVKSR